MTGAETLRAAAKLMRERAEAAMAGPWWPYERFSYTGIWAAETRHSRGRQVGSGRTSENAAHIASWHPAVALAVADWIDSHGRDLESAGGHLPSCDSPGDVQSALAVATTYLGLTTPP